MTILPAEIRTILKIAARDLPSYMNDKGNVDHPAPGTVIRPETVLNMTEEEQNKLLQRIKSAITEYFQRAGLSNENAGLYFNEVAGYLMGTSHKAPEIKRVMPTPSEAPTEQIQRPFDIKRRRRPPMERGPGRMPVVPRRRIAPNTSTNWYNIAKDL